MKKVLSKTEQKTRSTLLDIDESSLDSQGAEQVRLVWKYSALFAKAIAAKQRAEMNLEIVEAEEDARVRLDPSDFGLPSVTEPGVKRALIKSLKVQKARKVLIAATEQANRIQGMLTTLDHRRSVLSMFERLREQNYFVHPSSGKRQR